MSIEEVLKQILDTLKDILWELKDSRNNHD